ncbi:hypothetical protein MOW14_14675 (plasmid) [Acinetobacter indicus]|uniref:hypothetical protein n=1 Tax=Acinetobacter indicus TaxID=756892 RepID=UPI001FA77053|nr:hypothetical protein [Acinetobacter indicus]UNW11145.1 hypothetical protein MOW14_14675 [Acinetobacter indicus]
MKIEFLTNVKTLAELKKAYQKLCFKHHPDRGGDTATMQQINAEYDHLLKNLIDAEDDANYSENSYWQSKHQQTEVEKTVMEKLQAIIGLEGLEIEIIGVWIWVSGNTKEHKEALKEHGFKWIKAHGKWCFMGRKSMGRGGYTMDQMREKYGSKTVAKGDFKGKAKAAKEEKTERSSEEDKKQIDYKARLA